MSQCQRPVWLAWAVREVNNGFGGGTGGGTGCGTKGVISYMVV